MKNAMLKRFSLVGASPVNALALVLGGGSGGRQAGGPGPCRPLRPRPRPAGAYTLDKAHASLLFRVNHLSFSHWTARFTKFDAQLQFDPADPAKSSVKVTVDPKSIASDNAPEGFMATLAGPEWLDAGKYPEMTYRSD